MQALLLIYSDPAVRPNYGTPEFDQMMQGYASLGAQLRADGAYLSGDALKGSETAKTVRGRGAKSMVMDGPFAETREHLGGYYLIDVPDMTTALRYAAMVPTADHGVVEVRELAGVRL